MTAAFDCPKCGAPLGFNPQPGDETVVCPFCRETVIIPRDLRIPLPKVVVHPQPPPKKSNLVNWVVIGIILVACMVTTILVNPSLPSSDDSSTGSVSFDSGGDAATDIPEVDSATATVEAQSTFVFLGSILDEMQNWPASFVESFSDNSHDWQTGDVRDEYYTGNRSINLGKYTWKITSVKSVFDSSIPNIADQQDFFASMDMTLLSMPDDTDADAGLVLRYNDTDQTWYYFSVNQYGQYYFGWHDGTDWYTLIPETDSSAIHIGQTNRLSVGVQGSQFIFLINGEMVDHFIDENLKSGGIGVGINLPQADEKASVEFSNFKVLSPSTLP